MWLIMFTTAGAKCEWLDRLHSVENSGDMSPLQVWSLRLDEQVADFFVASLRKIFVVLADANE
jgi:hypothetical protein